MTTSRTGEIVRLESLCDAIPKQRQALTDKVEELRKLRDGLIAAEVRGDEDAAGTIKKLDAQILAALQDSSRLEERRREAEFQLRFVAIAAAGELAQQQLKALGKVEAELSRAISALAKVVNGCGAQQGFAQIATMTRTGGGHALIRHQQIGNLFGQVLQESLQTSVAAALEGREIGVQLGRARTLLEDFIEFLPEAKSATECDLEQERNRSRYERSRLDAVLAATV